jgi:hypothetical protein
VTVSGRHHGICDIVFDWFEEGACTEAHPAADIGDSSEPRLVWQCDCCGAGSAILTRGSNA